MNKYPEDHDGPLDEEIQEVPLEDSIDLHSFLPKDFISVVQSYLEAAIEAGFSEVRIIHGRGIGVQRKNIRRFLDQHPDVESFSNAPEIRSHQGATVVKLRHTPSEKIDASSPEEENS